MTTRTDRQTPQHRQAPPEQPGERPGEVPDTMRAVVQDAYGSAEVLQPSRSGTPRLAANEVLVRVRAAGLDRGTWHLMTGRPYLLRLIGFGFRRPKNRVPGIDVAGVVAA